MRRGKNQVQNIIIPTGTAAGRYETRITLDSEFDFCTGYYVIENSNGGLIRYNIGLKDDNLTYSDLVNSDHFQASKNYRVEDRFNSETPFRTKGKTVTVTLEIFAAPATDLNIDFLFRLKKEENC